MAFHHPIFFFLTLVAKRGISDGIAEPIMGHAKGNDIKVIYTQLHGKYCAGNEV